MNTPFLINNQPFFILGAQVHNSSGYGPETMQTAWKAIETLRANTAEVPVYWEQMEPREGEFTFDHLDGIIQGARERNLRLVLLWFGTWKNGSMQYVPEWVKTDPLRFPRIQTPGGSEIWVLSSHAAETFMADQRAYTRLLDHLRIVDSNEKTVIAVQIENEPGILGAARDYSPAADVEYNSEIPTDLSKALGRLEDSLTGRAWRSHGSQTKGTWPQVFGEVAAEVFSTWSIARYIDRLAQAGKAVYPLPVYVNVWLGENSWQLPGINYPSGGPVSFMLDVWKIATSNIDLIAPDIYLEPQEWYNQVCASYCRSDNPLFIPESGWGISNALNLFDAVARYHAIGVAIFGVESILTPDGTPRPEARPIIDTYRILSSMLPLLLHHHETGKLIPIIQREFMHEQFADLGDFIGIARFGPEGRVHRDYQHLPVAGEVPNRGRGLVLAAGKKEFYLAGAGFRLMLREKLADERLHFTKGTEQFDGPLTHYLRVEEGHFNPEGSWVIDRVRNGDEITNGLWVEPDCGIVHVIMG